MPKERINILAINPGNRYVGIAVFLGTELYDCAVRLMKGKTVQTIITEYIDRYDLHCIALKKLHLSRTSQQLQMQVSEIKRYAAHRELIINELSIDEVEKTLLAGKRKNKLLLIEEVVARYPFLMHELHHEKENKNPYLIRMFEAVGIGTVCVSQFDSGNPKVAKRNK